MLSELEHGAKVAGVKQVRRALRDGRAKALYAAWDADGALITPLIERAQEQGVPVHWVDTMSELGRACGLSVGAAVAAST